MVNDIQDQASRDRAVTQLKKRRDFHGHLLVYVLVNTFLVVIWVATGSGGFFWPVFPIAAWGVGVVMNAWDVYWRPEITEDAIQREIEREHGHHSAPGR
jgi:2TM domain